MPQKQTPTASDAEKRHDILQAIDEIVQTGLPEHPGLCIKPYGSYVSGLYCPSGDLDLSIEGVPTAGWVSLPGTQKIYPEEHQVCILQDIPSLPVHIQALSCTPQA